jgi:hypothetical protein
MAGQAYWATIAAIATLLELALVKLVPAPMSLGVNPTPRDFEVGVYAVRAASRNYAVAGYRLAGAGRGTAALSGGEDGMVRQGCAARR